MTNQQQKPIRVEEISSLSSMTGYWKQRTRAEKILFALLLSLFFGFSITITILVANYLRLESRLVVAHSKMFVTDDLEGRSQITFSTNATQNQVFEDYPIIPLN